MLTIQSPVPVERFGLSRRAMLQAGGAGLMGLSLPKVLEAGSQPLGEGPPVKAKSVIFLFLFGGPSQLETFDMKPEAPAKIRGPFAPIASTLPDLRICEHLPRIAQIADRLTVVRTMSHAYNDHSGGGHYVQTGRRWPVPIGGGFNVTPNDWPSMGSVVKYLDEKKFARARQVLPSYAVVPNSLGRLQDYSIPLRRPGETAGWLGRAYDPLTTRVDKRGKGDNPYFRDCTDDELQYNIDGLVMQSGMTADRIRQRESLLRQFDAQRSLFDRDHTVRSVSQFYDQAFSLVSSEATRRALDLKEEPVKLRDTYGRHLFGQSTLMARRLVEAGVRFVTVHYDACDGYSWDSHLNSTDVKNHLLPTFDQALAALVSDLEERGLQDETLVVAMGEMGRTPKANASWGRNHWSTLFPAVLAGGGMKRGYLYGETDADAEYAVTPPVSPDDLAATIYTALGIDPATRLPDAQNRPHPLVEEGHAVSALFA